jgi:hypothetical protein
MDSAVFREAFQDPDNLNRLVSSLFRAPDQEDTSSVTGRDRLGNLTESNVPNS